jgi:hypothetical protein
MLAASSTANRPRGVRVSPPHPGQITFTTGHMSSAETGMSQVATMCTRPENTRRHQDHHPPPGLASPKCPKDHPEISDSRPRQCTPPCGEGPTPGASTRAPLRWM